MRQELNAAMIRSLRRMLGLTQEDFAHEIQVTFSTVNRWENGHAGPSRLATRAIIAFAAQRGISLEDLEASSRAA